MLWHTFNQPLAIQFVTTSLCGGGVLERFPNLRCALLEGNCSWAPWLLDRLDEHYEWIGWYEATDLTMKPSDYFRRQCFLGVEAEEVTATQYVDWFGDDNLVFSTDYPHGDSQFPHAVDTFDKLPVHRGQPSARSSARTGSASTRSRWSSTPEPADGFCGDWPPDAEAESPQNGRGAQ